VNLKKLIAASPKRFRLIVCAFLFIVALARYWVNYDPAISAPIGSETYRIANSLYEHGQFANPFRASQTGPSAHLAPVFPGLLAGLMMIFGNQSAGLYGIQLAAVLILSLQLSLYPLFSRLLGMGSLTGFIAAAAWILGKPELIYGWEAFYASLVLAAACCLYRRQLDLKGPNGSTWVLGCVMGLLTLMLPSVLPVLCLWLAWEVWQRRAVFFKRFLLPLIVLPALIVVPWTIRNYLVFHRFVLVRDDLGLELAVSNNDCAQFSTERNQAGCFQRNHPNANVQEGKKIVELGEPEYNQERLREALDWMKTHPRQFAWLTTCRFIAWWMPTDIGKGSFAEYAGRGRLLERSVIYLMTLLSIAGLVILGRRDFRSAAVCAPCLIIFPILYYFVQYSDRYRDPVMWLTFLLGALPFSDFLQRLFSPSAWGDFSFRARVDTIP
jgi:hypothetical protein